MELQLRRNEMSQLYASLDQILLLSPSRLAPAYDRRQEPGADRNDSQRHRTCSSSPLVDLSTVGTAKLQLRSQFQEPAAVTGLNAEESSKTVRLEEEIRDMERKVGQSPLCESRFAPQTDSISCVDSATFGCTEI